MRRVFQINFTNIYRDRFKRRCEISTQIFPLTRVPVYTRSFNAICEKFNFLSYLFVFGGAIIFIWKQFQFCDAIGSSFRFSYSFFFFFFFSSKWHFFCRLFFFRDIFTRQFYPRLKNFFSKKSRLSKFQDDVIIPVTEKFYKCQVEREVSKVRIKNRIYCWVFQLDNCPRSVKLLKHFKVVKYNRLLI